MDRFSFKCYTAYILILSLVHETRCNNQCSRDRSRIVRGVVQHNIKSIFKSMDVTMPETCAFREDRDIFHLHEAHKTEESYGKWYCDYCGKGFYAESYLDKHLENKHSDKLYTGPDSVCLSDYCDIFRCDIIAHRLEPSFWDTALCIEDDMTDWIKKCDIVFEGCIPRMLSTNISEHLLNKTKNVVCSSLNCNRYWYTGKIDESQWLMLLKTFCTVGLIGGLIVYYFLAYHHFYTDSLYERPTPSEPHYFKSYRPHRQGIPRKVRKKYTNPS